MKNKILRKILAMTKIGLYGFLLQLLCISFLIAGDGLAQQRSIYDVYLSVQIDEGELIEAFKVIEKKTGFNFTYNDAIVNENSIVSLNISSKSLADVLTEISKKTHLKFKRINQNIHVSKRKGFEKSLEEIIDFVQERVITGKVTSSEDNSTLPGVNVIVKGTSQGTVTDVEGNYKLNVPDENTVLVFSSVGFVKEEVLVGNQTIIDFALVPDLTSLDEIVVIGYGTQKKVNLTGSVSVIGGEVMENRPISNIQQGLQGQIPGLVIAPTANGGEPGAAMAMNIRGLQSVEGNSQPFVLVDGIPMGINDVDPDDVESISVLKDAAASAIYGARAAYGVILITTKGGSSDGKVTFSYSGNYARSTPTDWPDLTGTMNFALAMNEGRTNAGAPVWLNDERLANLASNIAVPHSAPEWYENSSGTNWDDGAWGIKSSGDYDWGDILFDDSSPRQKHNLSVSGGNEKVNFYISGGFFKEDGILRHGNESYKRYNIDAKVNAEATSWLDLSLFVKYRHGKEDFPWSTVGADGNSQGRGRIFDALTKIKPTQVPFYPNSDVWNLKSRIGVWQTNRDVYIKRQLVISPRVVIEPIKDWKTSIEFNYIANDDRQTFSKTPTPWLRPGGIEDVWPGNGQAGATVRPNMYSNDYLSPTIRSEYRKTYGDHNFGIMVGYQHEEFNYYNLRARGSYLLSDNAISLSTAVGDKTVFDEFGHSATQSYFGRFNYNYAEKYLLEVNIRRDGSSRFEDGSRWATFPSFSAGWILSRENFYPFKNSIDFLKIRGSYGSLGNQNVDNYLYIATLPINQSEWLFNGAQAWTVGSPNLQSVNLTWEDIATIDFGLDLYALNNRLGFTVDWYQATTSNLVGPGAQLPATLGAAVPRVNEGEIVTEGWDLEISWQDRVNENFSWGLRGTLNDYTSKVTKYTNDTGLLQRGLEDALYKGKVMGEIWGFETDGLFQTQADIDSHVDQQWIYTGVWNTGDLRYVDQNGDGRVDQGTNTIGDSGDKKVIGNATPRFLYGIGGNAQWKGFDFSMFWQGVAKRDLNLSTMGTFRGPANGPFHATAYKEHMDFFRDDSSPLGANPDAYFPRPYAQYEGQNNKNFSRSHGTSRYLQNGAYIRLKNVQLGYTIPKKYAEKAGMSLARIYLSGENLLTFTKLMFYDPETSFGYYAGGSGTVGKGYPMSKTISLGLNIRF